MDYEKELREKILDKIEGIAHKIRENEDLPEDRKQDIHFLVEVDDLLDQIENNWNY